MGAQGSGDIYLILEDGGAGFRRYIAHPRGRERRVQAIYSSSKRMRSQGSDDIFMHELAILVITPEQLECNTDPILGGWQWI